MVIAASPDGLVIGLLAAEKVEAGLFVKEFRETELEVGDLTFVRAQAQELFDTRDLLLSLFGDLELDLPSKLVVL